MKQREGFKIRAYGRTELAQLYSPDITPGAAWRKLKGWITFNPRLARLLTDGQGRMLRGSRSFTPAEVEAIARELGEP
ncbi:MAG: DUF4248 domain-containing protein [Bacteroidaceae bacterium]|nr:DUF4248 domain-containing protein [Bacteroidaceae bacterium]